MISYPSQKRKSDKKMTRSKVFFTSFSLLTLFFFTACGYLWDTPPSSLKRESIDFGLVITDEHKYDSRIWWFDSKLQTMQEQKLSYAALGSSFYSPAENRDELYLIPVGLGNQKDTKKVISVNKKTLQITEYPSQHINLIHMASIGEKVYSVSNLNGISYLEAWDKKEGTSKTVELPGSYLTCIFPGGNKLFAFDKNMDGDDSEENVYTMRVYSEDLRLLHKKDISSFGSLSGMAMDDGRNLYATVNLDEKGHPTGKIIKINEETYAIEEIGSSYIWPHAIYRYDDKLIVTHHDPVAAEGSEVSVIDPDGKEKMIDLKVPLEATAMMGDRFIVANSKGVYQYELPSFKLLNSYPLQLEDGFYLTNILPVNELDR